MRRPRMRLGVGIPPSPNPGPLAVGIPAFQAKKRVSPWRVLTGCHEPVSKSKSVQKFRGASP